MGDTAIVPVAAVAEFVEDVADDDTAVVPLELALLLVVFPPIFHNRLRMK